VDTGDIRRDVLLRTVHHCHRGGGFEGRAEEGRLGAGLEMENAKGGGLLLYTIGSRRGLSYRKIRYVRSYF